MISDVGNAAVSDIVEPSKYNIDYKDWRQQSEGISRKDFSNAGISSKSSHHHPRSWRDTTAIPGSLRHMTAMEGGNADIAGANICPYILTIAAPPSMALCVIPYILTIAAPPSMALCVIPYILYIKKARSMRAFEYQLVKKAFRLLLDR
jgi:hypothetical protein